MNDILARLRMDAGRLTLAGLIQEREAAACEIERLQREITRLNELSKISKTTPQKSTVTVERKASRDMASANLQQGTFLRLRDVCAALAVSRSTIYKRVAEGTFPRPIKISERSVRWRSEDIEAWRTAIESKLGTP